MEVARAQGRRVAVLFQPHRYSRTRYFAREFADALAGADLVGLLPVYPAGEDDPGDAGSDVIAAHLQRCCDRSATMLDGVNAVPAWLDAEVREGDLLLTLGAGDIGRLVPTICAHLDRRATA